MTKKIFQNLKADLFKVAQEMTDEKRDTRFKSWAKLITDVDPNGRNGYAFDGDFVNDGTVELDLSKPALALVSFRHGSMKYNYGEYAVVKVNTDGTLTATDIMASDADGKGWALRIRDDLVALLAELDPVTDTSLCPHEHDLMMLGYNQAMLDYASFPITMEEDVVLTREQIVKIVVGLKLKAGLE